MFNQKYSNKKSILFKVLIVLFHFFNVVVTPVEEMTQDCSLVLQSEYLCCLPGTALQRELPISKLHSADFVGRISHCSFFFSFCLKAKSWYVGGVIQSDGHFYPLMYLYFKRPHSLCDICNHDISEIWKLMTDASLLGEESNGSWWKFLLGWSIIPFPLHTHTHFGQNIGRRVELFGNN